MAVEEIMWRIMLNFCISIRQWHINFKLHPMHPIFSQTCKKIESISENIECGRNDIQVFFKFDLINRTNGAY